MLIFRYKFLLIVLFQLFINCILANDINKKNNDTSIKNINYSCDDSLDKKVLRGDGIYGSHINLTGSQQVDITLSVWISNL